MKRKLLLKAATGLLCTVAMAIPGKITTASEDVPVKAWQAEVTFPDWKGYTDDTLAMNSMFSFFGYHDQGSILIEPGEGVKSFRMYLNGKRIDTTAFAGGGSYEADVASYTKDGKNTLQVSNIYPANSGNTVTVRIPYPEVLSGTPEEEGISKQALDLIEDLVESDIENGFTSAQLAVVRNGRLVYSNAWGKTNTYLPDGSVNADSPAVTTETLYDLASVTKMFSANYALQKLVTDGAVSLDAKITEFLGNRFVNKTVASTADDAIDPETVKSWKAELTIRDLLRHQGGFPASPQYPAPYQYTGNLEEGETYPDNPYFAGNAADKKTKKATVEMICKTPLIYKPGTKTLYSDVDYMILGLIVEKVTGTDLNSYLKETFFDPMGLTHISFNPLDNGFEADDCAATELNGNTRDHLLDYPGYRTQTIQGQVHDETAYYSMAGISGHAGLFSNAEDLVKLASVMLCGGYGNYRFFSRNVMDTFTASKKEDAGNWGLGWWRQGDNQRVWYFGTQADSDTIGHQGWTGTLVMIDPERNLVVAYLTNKINSPVTDPKKDANNFDGNWYTASTLGFVPQILSIGMDENDDISDQLLDLAADMAVESLKLADEGAEITGNHPSARNIQSKLRVFEKLADTSPEKEYVDELRKEIDTAYEKVRSDHKKTFNDVLLRVIEQTEDGGGYYTGREEKEELSQNAWEGMDAAVTITEDGISIDMEAAKPSFCSSACYMALLKALSLWDTDGQIPVEAWKNLKPYTVEDREYPIQDDGVGCWGRANANGPGMAVLAAQLGVGENTYIAPKETYASEEEYEAAWAGLQAGDFLKLFWNDKIGGDAEKGEWEKGHMVVFLKRVDAENENGEKDDIIYYWSSNGNGYMPDKGYGIGKTRLSKVCRAVATRITYAGAFANAKDMMPDDVDPWLYAIMDSRLSNEEELLTAIAGQEVDLSIAPEEENISLAPGEGEPGTDPQAVEKTVSFKGEAVGAAPAKGNTQTQPELTIADTAGRIILGDEQFDAYLPLLEGKRVALFSNQTGIMGDITSADEDARQDTDESLRPFGTDQEGNAVSFGEHILDALIARDVNVTAVFSPEHGFRGEAGAGEDVDSSVDSKTGVPVYSLYQYQNKHMPPKEDMDTFDVLVMDIQDVGLRYYTYYISMYYLMEACAEYNKPVILLDRPNPNGFYVDGPILKEEFRSGVGLLPIPIVHGMTLGELAGMINGEGWLEAGKDACDLTVIPCMGYTHQTKTKLIRNPSPNLKDMRAVYLYASTCFFENTCVSVGRGTWFPFETYGSPYLKDTEGYDYSFIPESISGAANPPFEGEECFGKDLRQIPIEEIWEEQIHLDYLIDAYQAVTGKNPDLSFFGIQDEDGNYWIDLLSGSDSLRRMIMEGKTADEIKASWQEEIEGFLQQRKPYLLYADTTM
ncbi:MAG: penicillin binding protein PBP4B [Blautia sp.]|nr:penicillin binding protein PBP4B [Blautia sp.]